jgi:hypothetical protein
MLPGLVPVDHPPLVGVVRRAHLRSSSGRSAAGPPFRVLDNRQSVDELR